MEIQVLVERRGWGSALSKEGGGGLSLLPGCSHRPVPCWVPRAPHPRQEGAGRGSAGAVQAGAVQPAGTSEKGKGAAPPFALGRVWGQQGLSKGPLLR